VIFRVICRVCFKRGSFLGGLRSVAALCAGSLCCAVAACSSVAWRCGAVCCGVLRCAAYGCCALRVAAVAVFCVTACSCGVAAVRCCQFAINFYGGNACTRFLTAPCRCGALCVVLRVRCSRCKRKNLHCVLVSRSANARIVRVLFALRCIRSCTSLRSAAITRRCIEIIASPCAWR
jgi:hypothetical protein